MGFQGEGKIQEKNKVKKQKTCFRENQVWLTENTYSHRKPDSDGSTNGTMKWLQQYYLHNDPAKKWDTGHISWDMCIPYLPLGDPQCTVTNKSPPSVKKKLIFLSLFKETCLKCCLTNTYLPKECFFTVTFTNFSWNNPLWEMLYSSKPAF